MALRPSLPASSSDFALTPSSSAGSPTSPADEFNPLRMRFRRPSLLAPPRATFYSEGRINSPLATASFTIPSRRYTSSSTASGEESESDKDKMWTDSPPSVDSGSTTPSTPSLQGPIAFNTDKDKSSASIDSDSSMKSLPTDSSISTLEPLPVAKRPKRLRSPPSTPSRPTASSVERENHETPSQPSKSRRISHPMSKMPRILSLLAEESHPEEIEVKSEAQFQRFVASFSDLPGMQPRTPRAISDRGRYPEEAGIEEPTREDTPSDSECEDDDVTGPGPFSFIAGGSEPININKPVTPAQSVNGDDMGLSESPGNSMAMDVDMPSSACGSPKLSSAWRYTPPPTSTSAVRSNKRKMDDRYDPYPLPAKRRAVSPSVSYLRESQPSLFTPRTPNGHGNGHNHNRMSLPHPIAIPVNIPGSGASSPVVTPSALTSVGTRPMSWGPQSVLSSPTLRAQMQIGLASPVLRPMKRRRPGDEREVDGTGEAVGVLTLEESER